MIRKDFIKFMDYNKGEYVRDSELLNFAIENMFLDKENIPSLFRYSAADYYTIRGLETETLFLSEIGCMNDIFEGLSCKIDDRILDQLDDLMDIAYIKAFSEESDNLLMWAHYAEKYAGICVEYDFSKLSESLLVHLFPVFYSNERNTPQILNNLLIQHKDLKRMNDDYCYPNDTEYIRDIMSLYVIKPKCWEYEKEWRLVATYPQIYNTADDIGDEENSKFYEIESREISVKDCIKSVFIGPRMKSSIREHIKEICKEKLNNIPVYEYQLSETEYKLEIKGE